MQVILTPAAFSDNDFSKIKKEFIKGYKSTQSHEFKEAIKKFQKIKEAEVAVQDYILYYLATSLHSEKRCDESKKVFHELVSRFPESRWYFTSKDQVDATSDCSPLLQSTIAKLEYDCGSLGDLTDRADCFFKNRQYREAKQIYRSLPESAENLRRLSQSAARSQDFRTAIEANEEMAQKYPKSASSAIHTIAFLHMDAQDFKEAIPLLKTLIQKTKRSRDKVRYYERLGWCYYRTGQYSSAVESFDQAFSNARTPFSLYWKGRALAKMGQEKKAKAIFERLLEDNPNSYYAIRSMERMNKPVFKGSSYNLRWVEKIDRMGEVEGLRKVEELLQLGLTEDARIELRRARWATRHPLPPDPTQVKRDGDGFQFERRDPDFEDPDYRLPYADFLFSHCQRNKANSVDPFLLYGLMRQESRFREWVVSPVGAIGILQIMPQTGQKVAREAGWENFDVQWLYDPLTNIELAIHYLEKLHHLMNGKWYAIAASYNAGEDVVSEWLKQRATLSEEEFIEEIPYSETRDYVKKVYANWVAYRSIYGK